MPKFKKKPVEIEAVLFTGENWAEVNQFVGKTFDVDGELHWGFLPVQENSVNVTAEVWDVLHHTWVGVKNGQWIIKGVQGEFYPCDPEVFEKTYDKVED